MRTLIRTASIGVLALAACSDYPTDPSVALAMIATQSAAAGFTTTQINSVTTEFGGVSAFYLSLKSAPLADVTIGPFSTSNSAEAVAFTTSVTFTTSNWSAPQLVIFTGVDDNVVDGTQSYTINMGNVVSQDTTYNSLTPPTLSGTNTDSDKYMYVTSSTYMGGFIDGALSGVGGPAADGNTGIDDADIICNFDANKPAVPSGTIFKAMLVDVANPKCGGSPCRRASAAANTGSLGGGQIDWVLKPFYQYRAPTTGGHTGNLVMVPGFNSIYTMNAGACPLAESMPVGRLHNSLVYAWTGLQCDWVTSPAANCGNWAVPATPAGGRTGDPTTLDHRLISTVAWVCNGGGGSTFPLICVQQ